ncbi:MAG: hypothetical protein Tsb0032_42030 [Kiloniellaceae bacterium]
MRRSNFASGTLVLAGAFAALLAAAAPARAIPGDIAVLQGLDKITARISTFEAPLDQPVRFGSLQIIARACDKHPPEEPPESTAFLEIVDIRPDSPAVELFTGWMFASSPAVSAVEHPVYDVWVVDCKKASSSASETAPE